MKPQSKPRRQQALRKRCTQLAPRLQPKGQEGEDASPCHDSGGSVQINTPPPPNFTHAGQPGPAWGSCLPPVRGWAASTGPLLILTPPPGEALSATSP